VAEIINLRQVRKAKARAQADAQAETNRIAFGQPKKAKTLQQRRKALEAERHEGHRLQRPEPDSDPAE